MAITPNTITSQNTINATFSEYISKYQGDYDRFEEMVGLFPPVVAKAGEQLFKYVVSGQLTDQAIDPGTVFYEKTKDTDIVNGKTYYTKSGDTYSAVASPAKADLGTYYVASVSAGASAGRTYVEGDEVALSEFKLDKVLIGETNFFPYRWRVTAQALQRGGFRNAFGRFVDQGYKQLRADTVSDIFNWLNLFDQATIACPASGSTWKLQQLIALTEEKLLDTLETHKENDTDIIHFMNRGDVYRYLSNAEISTQTLFGMTYLERFLGVDKVFLSNRITAGTMVATPVSNLKSYCIDFD